MGLLVVLGHTGCGAVAAATQVQLANCLKALLERLETPVGEAIKSSASDDVSQMVELGIQLNVWHTIEELLRTSSTLRAAVLEGRLEIQGCLLLGKWSCQLDGTAPRTVKIAQWL